MNKVILTGRLTKDVDLKYTQSGKAVAQFSNAIDDGYGDNKKVYYPNIIVWGKSAEACGNCIGKGSKVNVCGKLTTRSYDAKDGTKRHVTEIVADMYGGVEFLDGKKQGGGEPQTNEEPAEDIQIPF
jgi:single-strand DNA-binding protein